MKKFLLICIISFFGGFTDAFLKDNQINLTSFIFVIVGYIDYLILNEF